MYPLRSLFPHLFLSIAHVPRYLWIQIIDLIDYEGGMKSVPNPPLSKMMVLPQPAGCCKEKKNVPGPQQGKPYNQQRRKQIASEP